MKLFLQLYQQNLSGKIGMQRPLHYKRVFQNLTLILCSMWFPPQWPSAHGRKQRRQNLFFRDFNTFSPISSLKVYCKCQVNFVKSIIDRAFQTCHTWKKKIKSVFSNSYKINTKQWRGLTGKFQQWPRWPLGMLWWMCNSAHQTRQILKNGK